MSHDFETELKLKKMQSKTMNKHVLLGMEWVFGNVTCMMYFPDPYGSLVFASMEPTLHQVNLENMLVSSTSGHHPEM